MMVYAQLGDRDCSRPAGWAWPRPCQRRSSRYRPGPANCICGLELPSESPTPCSNNYGLKCAAESRSREVQCRPVGDNDVCSLTYRRLAVELGPRLRGVQHAGGQPATGSGSHGEGRPGGRRPARGRVLGRPPPGCDQPAPPQARDPGQKGARPKPARHRVLLGLGLRPQPTSRVSAREPWVHRGLRLRGR
jgi:hypothetical protein